MFRCGIKRRNILILLTASFEENLPVLYRYLFQRFEAICREARTHNRICCVPFSASILTFRRYTASATVRDQSETGRSSLLFLAADQALKPALGWYRDSAAGSHRLHRRNAAECRDGRAAANQVHRVEQMNPGTLRQRIDVAAVIGVITNK